MTQAVSLEPNSSRFQKGHRPKGDSCPATGSSRKFCGLVESLGLLPTLQYPSLKLLTALADMVGSTVWVWECRWD